MSAFIPATTLQQMRRNAKESSRRRLEALAAAGMDQRLRDAITDTERLNRSLSDAFAENQRCVDVEDEVLRASKAAGRPLSEDEILEINRRIR